MLQRENAAVWDEYFSHKAPGDWRGARLGVGGSTVEELTWRMMAGGERLAKDPLVRPRWGRGCRGCGQGRTARVRRCLLAAPALSVCTPAPVTPLIPSLRHTFLFLFLPRR